MTTQTQSDLETLLAHLIQKVDAQTLEIRQLRQDIQVLRSQSVVKDPDDRWVVGIREAAIALADQGVSVDNIKAYLACGVLGTEDCSESPEIRNKGTDKQSRWEFHVGRCKARVGWFKGLELGHQRRILDGISHRNGGNERRVFQQTAGSSNLS